MQELVLLAEGAGQNRQISRVKQLCVFLCFPDFRILFDSGKPFITRIPLIPGVTDTEQNLTDVARFLCHNGVKTAELLPYNKLAGSKYASVGRRYAPGFDETVIPQARTDIFRSFGVEPKVLWGGSR